MGFLSRFFAPDVVRLLKAGDRAGLRRAMGHDDWEVRLNAALAHELLARDGLGIETLIGATDDSRAVVAAHAKYLLSESVVLIKGEANERAHATLARHGSQPPPQLSAADRSRLQAAVLTALEIVGAAGG